MARLRRKRWPEKDLLTRWRCPDHADKPEAWPALLRRSSDGHSTPELWWRPSRVLCTVCGMETEYEGFVKERG